MLDLKLLLILPLWGCLGVVTHQLYDLTPAPFLNKDYSQYKTPAYLGYRDSPLNVYRDTNDITDQTELTDAIRTQDKDHLVSDILLILILTFSSARLFIKYKWDLFLLTFNKVEKISIQQYIVNNILVSSQNIIVYYKSQYFLRQPETNINHFLQF